MSRSSRRARGAQARQPGAGGVTEQGSRRRDLGVAEALTVGSKAGHGRWDQIAKDPDRPAKAWTGTSSCEQGVGVNDKPCAVDNGEVEWRKSS